MLLKRTGTQSMPFLWCIIGSNNHRFQYFVPFSKKDQHWTDSGRMLFREVHYPSWIQRTEIEQDVWDWSSDQRTRRSFDVTINLRNATVEGADESGSLT